MVERDFVRSVVHFANTGSLRQLAMQVSGLPVPDGPIDDPLYQERADARTTQEFEAERDALKRDLSVAISGTPSAEFVNRVHQRASVLIVPQVKAGEHYVVSGLPGALCYALKLALDRKKPYRADLHCCQFCEAFFFTSDAKRTKQRPGGRDRTKYCSDEHMNKARDKRRTERKQVAAAARHK
jgi:hypothetical protein